MNIDFDLLRRHSLNRFTLRVTVTPGDEGPTYLVRTEPVRDDGVIISMLGKIHELLEDGATEASVTVPGEGGMQCRGFKPGTNTALLALLGPGRERYLDRLKAMFDENALSQAVEAHATEIVFGKLTLADLSEVKAECMEDHPGTPLLRLIRGISLSLNNLVIPGAICELPGDFRAEFNRQREEAFPGLVRDFLRKNLPEIEEKAREQLDRIIAAQRMLEQEN